MKKKMKSMISILLVAITLFACIGTSQKIYAASNPYPTTQDWDGDGYYEIPCTRFAWQQVYDNLGIALPAWGNAGTWYQSAINAGIPVGSVAKPGSVAVWSNHVAYVISASGNTFVVNEGGRTDLDQTDSHGVKYGYQLTNAVGAPRPYDSGNILLGFIYPAGTGQTITPATLSCTAGNSASATKFSWNGGTDCEFYSLRIFRKVNGTYTDTNSVWNLKTRSHNVVLPAGDYRAYVDCVIGSNYKASNEVYFTVKSSSANLGQSFDARILQSTSKCPIGVEQEYKYDVKLLASNRYVEEYWHFERQSDGSYVMKSLYNGDVLDCANAEKVNGTNVCTFRWHEHDAQRWYIYNTGDGYYRFIPKHAQHLSLDLCYGGTAPGTNVQLYEWNGGANQKFSIEKATVIPIKTLALSNHTLAVGNSVTLSARKTPSNANMTKLTWSSSNPSVATVDSNGMVKAKKVGTTKITVTSQFDKRISAQATITVQKVITAVKGDADGDGKVSANDALTILMHIAGKNPKNYFGKAADCDGTAGVTVNDALAILMHLAGKKALGS